MPTNVLLDALRTRRGLKWGVPAMLLALPYLYLASLVTVLIAERGWSAQFPVSSKLLRHSSSKIEQLVAR